MTTDVTKTETVEATSETQAASKDTKKTPTLEELQAQLEESQKHIKQLNRENAERRKKLDEFEKSEADRKAAEMSETDKLKAKVEQAEKTAKDAQALANERLIRSEIVMVATRLGFADPTDAVALLDKTKVEVKDDGTVDGVEDALKALLKAKPHLGKRTVSGSVTNPSVTNGSGETDEQRRRRLGMIR